MAIPRAELRRSYDRSADGYDETFWPLQKIKFTRVLAALPLAPTASILDLGAGTGLLARLLPRRFVALDLSRGMLERAPRHLYRVQADSDALPFADGSFDAVLSFTALLHIPALTASFAEVRRVLRAGGSFAFSLLREDRYPSLESQLQSVGLRPYRELACGQDVAWLCETA